MLETISKNLELVLAEIASCSQQSGDKVRRGRYFGHHFGFGSVAVVHFLHNGVLKGNVILAVSLFRLKLKLLGDKVLPNDGQLSCLELE